jgi:hypothetical protein
MTSTSSKAFRSSPLKNQVHFTLNSDFLLDQQQSQDMKNKVNTPFMQQASPQELAITIALFEQLLTNIINRKLAFFTAILFLTVTCLAFLRQIFTFWPHSGKAIPFLTLTI